MITARWVRMTESTMATVSSGRRVRRSRTSALISISSQSLGGFKRLGERTAISYQAHVGAGPPHCCFIDLHRAGVGGQIAFDVVQHTVLNRGDGVPAFCPDALPGSLGP